VLALQSPDPLLAVVGSVGLAAAAGTALVIDLGRLGTPGARTLQSLDAEGPTMAELSPGRPGVAMLAGGGVDVELVGELVERLSASWPAIVVRVVGPSGRFPMVPFHPLYPGFLIPVPDLPRCVWQPVGTGASPPGAGFVLPRQRSRWVNAWAAVWEMPWA
jgi:hypothetical protein